MRPWLDAAVRFARNEDGPTAVEYAVMLALIIVVCFVAIASVGNAANTNFNNVALKAAVGGS
ncbi:MAG TPA: Flp family type IVb pilin [Gemmataceae bacterium]|nr:Flp family type IVb pilin [Gemmataceae bacterium]